MATNSDTVSKTVRLPRHVVDYVNIHEGRTFTAKLINLLDEVQNGEAKRIRVLNEYDRQIAVKKETLNELYQNTYNANLVSQKLDRFYNSISDIVN
jgi:antitoxin component of MazEF toxin-antitoxin module